jgi:hypothetical protein
MIEDSNLEDDEEDIKAPIYNHFPKTSYLTVKDQLCKTLRRFKVKISLYNFRTYMDSLMIFALPPLFFQTNIVNLSMHHVRLLIRRKIGMQKCQWQEVVRVMNNRP